MKARSLALTKYPVDNAHHHTAHAGGHAGAAAAALDVLRPFCGDHPAQGDQMMDVRLPERIE